MSLESTLERIADTLDAIAAKQGVEITKKGPGRPAGSGKPAASTPDLTKTTTETAVVAAGAAQQAAADTVVAKGPTREAVQKAVTDGITAGQRDAVVAILQKFGGTNVSTCKAEDYPAIKAQLDALLLAG